MLPNPDHVYARHLTELGEQTEVLASEDIRTESGMTLLAKGQRIDREKLDRLVKHKLLRPIDSQVSVSNAVGAEQLLEEARRIMDVDPGFGTFMRAFRPKACMNWCLGQIIIPPVMRTKLTVAYNREPSLFTHSVRVTIAAVILADTVGLSSDEVKHLATAALFHDVGELHIDLKAENPDEPLDSEDRKQVYAHPVIGHLILKEMCQYPLQIPRAVLEHHERLDGTGYPRGLGGTSISSLGKLLSFIEFAVGVVQKHPFEHLATIVRAYPQRFDRDVVRAFFRLFGSHREKLIYADAATDQSHLHRLATELFRSLSRWRGLPTISDQAAQAETKRFLDEALLMIELSISRAGVSLKELSRDVAEFENQMLDMMELKSLLYEADFQLQRAIREVYRRWPEMMEPAFEGGDALQAWLRETSEALESL